MEECTQEKAVEFKARAKSKLASSEIQKLLGFLPNSEFDLILYMVYKNVWKGTVPAPPKNYNAKDSSIEFGLFLYWFKHKKELNLKQFTYEEQFWIDIVIDLLDIELPDSKLDKQHYDFFKTNELIYSDGTVLSTEQYATFDQGWFTAFINLFISLIDNLWYNGGKFPMTTPAKIALAGATQGSVSIAIIGDWGAKNTASKAVMDHIVGLNPDYIIHVGDVYYAGTPQKKSPTGDRYLAPGEEYQNLLDVWPSKYAGKSFTLNSNHEMYSGANGLFYDALGANRIPIGSNTSFSAQKGASCFALEYGGWTLLGLDSAYQSYITTAFMTGSIGTPLDFQTQWMQHKLTLNPAKTIVFTHHNGFEDDCASVSPLWSEVQGALKGDPFAWYWGHVHNGIVYKQPLKLPFGTHSTPVFNTNTFARCLGHAALPYGMASSLQQPGIPIAYKADNPKTLKPKELCNGFAILTLKASNNQVNSITERFYDVSTKPQPVFTNTLL